MAVNAGFTYLIRPAVSVITMLSASCSTAANRPACSTMLSRYIGDFDEVRASCLFIGILRDFLRRPGIRFKAQTCYGCCGIALPIKPKCEKPAGKTAGATG